MFYRSTLPPAASFVNVGVPGATVADALEVQVSQAMALRPGLVTVWLNVNDLIKGVPAAPAGAVAPGDNFAPQPRNKPAK